MVTELTFAQYPPVVLLGLSPDAFAVQLLTVVGNCTKISRATLERSRPVGGSASNR
jgi:hypothetical protein